MQLKVINDAVLAQKAIIIYFFIYLKAVGFSETVRNVQDTMVVCRSRFSPAFVQETFCNVLKLNHMDIARHINTEALTEKSMIITPPARGMKECRGGIELQMHHLMLLFPPPNKFYHFIHPTKQLLTSLKGRHYKKAAGLSGAVRNAQDIKIIYRSRLCRRLPTIKLNHTDNTKHIKMEAPMKKSMITTPSALSMIKCARRGELQRRHRLLCPPSSKFLHLTHPTKHLSISLNG